MIPALWRQKQASLCLRLVWSTENFYTEKLSWREKKRKDKSKIANK